MPIWAAASDGFTVETTAFANTLDLTGATISLDVYLPESYVEDGKLAIQIYFFDSDNKFANGGYKEASWGGWRWNGSEAGTVNRYGWITLSYDISSAGIKTTGSNDPAGWFNPDGIDITKINRFGVEILSNSKPVNVTGDIKFDNVVLPGM